jgi:ABC-2 type transport system permease protein
VLRLLATIHKELIILVRDKGGLAVMFLMPMALITIMALIQDAPFKDYQEMKIPLALVNHDNGKLGKSIEAGLRESKIFEINTKEYSERELKQKVKRGDYEIGILIPEDATKRLEDNVNAFVAKKLAAAGMGGEALPLDDKPVTSTDSAIDMKVVFAPTTKKSFRASILGSLKQSASKLETQTLLAIFSNKLNRDTTAIKEQPPMADFIAFTELNAIETPKEALQLNSVQHNVPAWTIFGMFFIVISLAGSIIKERESGSYTRLLTMPGNYLTIMAGKVTAYLVVCLIQCLLMLLVGIYLLPYFGLPWLVIGKNIPAIAIVAASAGLAATGYGIMVGSLFSSQQQSSTFGAVSVVILAALGGIWVPVYVMPDAIRMFAGFSPLYWALTAFHKIFLGDGDIISILPYTAKLIGFFIATIGISYFYNKSQTR